MYSSFRGLTAFAADGAGALPLNGIVRSRSAPHEGRVGSIAIDEDNAESLLAWGLGDRRCVDAALELFEALLIVLCVNLCSIRKANNIAAVVDAVEPMVIVYAHRQRVLEHICFYPIPSYTTARHSTSTERAGPSQDMRLGFTTKADAWVSAAAWVVDRERRGTADVAWMGVEACFHCASDIQRHRDGHAFSGKSQSYLSVFTDLWTLG
jgi:hypothetical protein